MKVLIITGRLQNYRVPIFNEIVKRGIDLTVAHSYGKLNDGTFLFKEVILDEKSYGPITKHKINLKEFCNAFEIVVATFYLQKLSFMSLLFGKRKFKLVYWGIGVKASQNSKFDTPTLLNKIRYIIANKSDAMIFYTDYVKDKYIKNGVNPDKLFVMNNTVFVNQDFVKTKIDERNNILFIGKLNKSKKIFILLEAYKKLLDMGYKPPIIDIVGVGPDFHLVKEWVMKYKLNNFITLHGAVYEDPKKAEIFNRALCVISPGQAGLSVLESMGYGIPFITYKDAITGGERLNITHGFNGILMDNFEEMPNILLDIMFNKIKFIEMGNKAKKYYLQNRSLDKMVEGFIETINYLKK